MAHYHLTLPITSRRKSISPAALSWHDPRIAQTVPAEEEDSESDIDSEPDEKDHEQNGEAQSSVAERWKHFAKKARGLQAFEKSKKNTNRFVSLNIGGQIFRTTEETLRRRPYTKLAILTEKSKHFNEDKNEYFFDRNPEMFNCILDYYRTGEIHIPKNICARYVHEELFFWGLSDQCLPKCCHKYLNDALDEIATYEILQQEFQELPNKMYGESKIFNFSSDLGWRKRIWVCLDESSSSLLAKVWAVLYMLMVILSILSVFIGTLSTCRVSATGGLFHRHIEESLLSQESNEPFLQNLSSQNEPNMNNTVGPASSPLFSSKYLEQVTLNNKKVKMLLTTQPHDVLLYIDFICMIFFTVEFIIRFIVCPRRLKLLKNTWTFLDLMYLIPVWLLFLIDLIDNEFWHNPDRISGLLILQALMVFRVFRMFRFVRHFRGLKLLWLAIRASVSELFLLFVFVSFAITIYASLIFCAEIFNENSYENIFVGLWWALITMTTVGYGDVYPETWAGYIVACFCAFTGIIIIGMPVPIIASNFHAYYGLRIPEEVVPETKKKRVKPMPKHRTTFKL